MEKNWKNKGKKMVINRTKMEKIRTKMENLRLKKGILKEYNGIFIGIAKGDFYE